MPGASYKLASSVFDSGWNSSQVNNLRYISRPALRAAGAKALTTQNWPARLWLKGHAVGFAALIANNLEPFALTASLARAAKVSAPRISAGFATLWMGQATLAIVVLLSFRKRKRRSALGTRNL